MKSFLQYLLAACFSAALVLSPALIAKQDGKMGHGRGEMKEKMGEKMKEKLGLSDEQFKKFQEANKANGEAMKPLRDKQKETIEKLKAQVEAKAKDADIQATLDQAAVNQKAIQAQQDKHKDALKEILTPTQQAKMVLGMAKRMHEGMDRGWNKGGDKEDDKDEDKGKDKDKD